MKERLNRNKTLLGIVFLGLVALFLPITLLLLRDARNLSSNAALPDQLESEQGVLSSTGVSKQSDSGASGGQFVLFNKSSAPSPTTDPGNCNPLPTSGTAVTEPTFHSIGLYWDPPSNKGPDVNVRFRKVGTCTWNDGYPIKYNPITQALKDKWGDTQNDRADYRGSIVSVTPNTEYEVELSVNGTNTKSVIRTRTWSENFPEGEVVNVGNRSSQYTITSSGTASAYKVYDGGGSTIDVNGNSESAIRIQANYVIVRNFKLRDGARYGIRIDNDRHHIVIENNEITGWGEHPSQAHSQSAIHVPGSAPGLSHLVIQRNRMHSPRHDAWSWGEEPDVSGGHARGQDCGVINDSGGSNVIRYNECYSGNGNYLQDGFAGGDDKSWAGSPGPDSDIYGNYVGNVHDDSFEIEGAGRNIRVWNNFTDEYFISFANNNVSIGPLYIFRNISRGGAARWLKGESHSHFSVQGLTYVFHNTITDAPNLSEMTVGTRHTVARNNLWNIASNRDCYRTGYVFDESNIDYDLCAGDIGGSSPYMGSNNISNKSPIFQTNNFNRENLTASYTQSSSSPGYRNGESVPNFSYGFSSSPDRGAHQSGWPDFKYGVNASYSPQN